MKRDGGGGEWQSQVVASVHSTRSCGTDPLERTLCRKYPFYLFLSQGALGLPWVGVEVYAITV